MPKYGKERSDLWRKSIFAKTVPSRARPKK
jgi:hypothetical protein